MMRHHPARARLAAGLSLVLLSLALFAGSGLVLTAPASAAEPAKIEGKVHEGQLQGIAGDPSTLGGYTSGNLTVYQEGDKVNFHYTLTANYDGLAGVMEIRFSREAPGVCAFFEPSLVLGSHTTGLPAVQPVSGEVPTLVLGALTASGNEWVQQVGIQFSTGTVGGDEGGEAIVNYHLTLDQNVTGCTGSSQHSRLSAPDAAGDYKQTGMQNVPIPASAVVRLPDITVTKMIDRDGDGVFESTALAGEYSFTLDGTTSLLTDAGGQVFFENVQPDGGHSITETQEDFSLGAYQFISGSGANCTFDGDTATADVAAGTITQVQHASCVFNNAPVPGSITIIKDAVGADAGTAEFDFTATGLAPAAFALGDGESQLMDGLAPGLYTVAETGEAGWDLTGVVCQGDAESTIGIVGGEVTIDLAASEDITCTFTNTERGRIYVDKVTDPSGSAQQFEFDPSWGGNFLLDDGDAPHDSGLLVPGNYAVAEVNLPAGWSQASATCTDGSDPAAIGLGAGETVTCVFSNMLERGRIYVDKVTDPSGSLESFEFDPSWGANFFLADADAAHDSGALLPGTYSVAEVNLPAGWSLTGAVCSDGSDPASIDLAAGEVVTCTFTDTLARGHIVVDKVTDPAGDPTEFEFDPSWGANFFLTHAGAPVDSGELLPGLYSVAEVNLPAGWSPAGVICSDGSDPASIDLAAGETVTCVFTNLNPPEGSITIVKDATPLPDAAGDTPFDFTGDLGSFQLMDPSDPAKMVTGLAPGSYTVAEGALPENWLFDKVECDALDWSADGASVTVNLAQGEAAVCTFFNFEEAVLAPTASLTIIKDADPADDTVFHFDAGALGTFALQDPSDPSEAFTGLEAGTYIVSENTLPAVWGLTGIECTAADWSVSGRSVTVNLGEGEVASCTFFNEGELPFTGTGEWSYRLMLAGLASILAGLGLLVAHRLTKARA